ncbi:hypothetical protein Tco_0829444 [Tanacetum coccineum]
MTTLKFADTHNMVVFLAKPAESEGFEQIVDFLNAYTIKEVQLQALVDGKKIIITESIVRRDIQLEDAEGVECLPNATIFENLTLMGYEKISQKLTFYKAFFSPQWKVIIHNILQCLSSKTTAWNEFSSIMASTIICLAINQKITFSKYIFESMVKNLENVSGKFLMYPSGPTDNVADEAVNEEMNNSLKRATTIATSLDAEQDREVTHFEVVKNSWARLYKVGLNRRVESSDEEGLGEEDASKYGRIADIDANARITLDSTHFDVDTNMFGVHELDGDEVIVSNEDVITTNEETRSMVKEVTAITIPLKSATPKADKVVIQEPDQDTTTPTLTTTTAATTITAVRIRPRAKGLVIQPVKKMSKKDLLRLDEELAFKLQAEEEDEEERLAKEKSQQVKEANIA